MSLSLYLETTPPRFAQQSSHCCWIGLRSRQLLKHEARERAREKDPRKCGGGPIFGRRNIGQPPHVPDSVANVVPPLGQAQRVGCHPWQLQGRSKRFQRSAPCTAAGGQRYIFSNMLMILPAAAAATALPQSFTPQVLQSVIQVARAK